MMRLPRFVLTLIVTLTFITAPGGAQNVSNMVRTCAGSISALDATAATLLLDPMPGGVSSFVIEPSATMIFRGIWPLRVDELRPGMRVGLDYQPPPPDGKARVTWIEIEEEDPHDHNKISTGKIPHGTSSN